MRKLNRSKDFLTASLLAGSVLYAVPGFALPPAPQIAPPQSVEPARQLLMKTLARYRKLDTFAMDIQQQEFSSLYPGPHTHKLQWRRGGKFTLLATSPHEKRAPNCYSDGKHVIMDLPGVPGIRAIENLALEPHHSSAWEACGGLIVSVLQQTEQARWFQGKTTDPVVFTFGTRSQWHGKKVREIVLRGTGDFARKQAPVLFFVDPAGKIFYGMEVMHGTGKQGYAFYSNQRFNPTLPATLGNAPPAQGRKIVDVTQEGIRRSPYVPPSTLAPGTVAPDFTVEDKDGKPVKLSDFAGKVVVLDFWATWCGPCQESLPHTNQVAGQFKEVVVLAVNTWDEKDKFTRWLTTNQSRYANLAFVFDPHGRDGDIAQTLYQVRGIPTQYVIGRDGKIVQGMVGYDGESNTLRDTIQQALAAPAPDTTKPSAAGKTTE